MSADVSSTVLVVEAGAAAARQVAAADRPPPRCGADRATMASGTDAKPRRADDAGVEELGVYAIVLAARASRSVIDPAMVIDVIMPPALEIYTMMMIVMNVRAADHRTGHPADDRTRRPGDDGSTRGADDGAGHRAGERLRGNSNNSANRCEREQEFLHRFSLFLKIMSRRSTEADFAKQ
jgi:hypothetical protein